MEEFFENMENRGRDFLKKRMREERWDKMIKGDGGVNKIENCGFYNGSRFERLYGCKILERVLSEFRLLFERDLSRNFDHDKRKVGNGEIT
jgi:hypothetical protein